MYDQYKHFAHEYNYYNLISFLNLESVLVMKKKSVLRGMLASSSKQVGHLGTTGDMP